MSSSVSVFNLNWLFSYILLKIIFYFILYICCYCLYIYYKIKNYRTEYPDYYTVVFPPDVEPLQTIEEL